MGFSNSSESELSSCEDLQVNQMVSSSSTISQPTYSEISSPAKSITSDQVENVPTFKIVGDNVDKYIKPRHEIPTDIHLHFITSIYLL
jgi:hypothetical protein